MSRLSCALFVLAAAGFFAATGAVCAQPNAENVNFLTPDGVKIKGQFFPADAKCVATVIMLHPVGEGKSMKDPAWKNLAVALQKANYSVLMFDFRGHGDSTEIVEPKDFWTKQANIANVKTKSKDEIDVKDYIKQGAAYLPILVNDITAARSYLDRRNDNMKDCNTSSLIVIGAENGATLGAIWINSEWSRYKYLPPANPLMKPTLAKNPEGADIIGAVFLGITPSLEKRPISIPAILRTACKEKAMAAAFFCGKDDAKGDAFAKTLEKDLKVAKSKKHEYIGPVELETNLTGMKLLTKGLKADQYIVDYLGSVVDDRKVEWSDREFEKSIYVRPANGKLIGTKNKGDKTLLFDDYNKFIPQK